MSLAYSSGKETEVDCIWRNEIKYKTKSTTSFLCSQYYHAFMENLKAQKYGIYLEYIRIYRHMKYIIYPKYRSTRSDIHWTKLFT